MFDVRLAYDHLCRKWLFHWLSLGMSLMVPFRAVRFLKRCLGWNLELNICSFKGCPTYSWWFWNFCIKVPIVLSVVKASNNIHYEKQFSLHFGNKIWLDLLLRQAMQFKQKRDNKYCFMLQYCHFNIIYSKLFTEIIPFYLPTQIIQITFYHYYNNNWFV